MKRFSQILTIALLSLLILSCDAPGKEPSATEKEILYESENLIITRISKNSFIHTSYLQTEDFGKVPCNGLIVTNLNEAVIFDTPTNDSGSEELIQWIKEQLHCKINAVIPTHFHEDCLGGLKAFNDNNIPSYAYFKTIELAKENNFTVPVNSFSDAVLLPVGDKNVMAKFFGEGHTKDNVVGYYFEENILFGGCLLKELKAGEGYLGDANVNAWSATVKKIKEEYPEVTTVIPGHGAYGGKDLLDYTINLFKAK